VLTSVGRRTFGDEWARRPVQVAVRAILIALSLFAAVSAGAMTIAPGDIAVVPQRGPYGIQPLPLWPMYLLDGTGVYKGAWPGSDDVDLVAFGPNNHLFGIDINSIVFEVDGSFNLVRTIPPVPGQAGAAGFLIGPNGDFYVLDYLYVLYILSPAGQVKTSYPLPSTQSNQRPTLDLASDGCTVLYTDGTQTGRRFDACTGTALANLPGGPATVVRALADGGFVTVWGITLSFYDATDRLIRSFAIFPNFLNTITDLRFDSDPRFLWLTGYEILKVRIADGYISGGNSRPPHSVAVNGEQRPTIAEVGALRRHIAPHAFN
jgi:hypothetical protein